MEKYIKKIKPKYYFVVAFIITAITYAITFSYMGMLGNGKYIIARSDLKQQYIPFIEYFCSVLRGEHTYGFSWSLNMGTGTALLHAYYTLSPFNLFYLLLGEGREMTATALAIVLKASTAAAAFQLFIQKYLKRIHYETVLFAVMYALCGFQVCYYFDMMWMDAFYMFPVIGIGIIRLAEERKCLGLLLSYGYIFAVNFYMGYIAGLSSFFLFLFYFFYHCKKRSLKINLKILFFYGVAVIGAVLASAVVWLPAAIQLLGNKENGYPDFELAKCNILFLFNNLFMGQMQTLNGVTPFVYCGLLSLLLLPLFFGNKKIPVKKRVFFLLCLLWFVCLFLIEPLNAVMHAFDKPEMFAHRFSFVFSFLITVICCEQVLYIKKVSSKAICILLAGYLILFGVCRVLYLIVWNEEYNTNTLLAFVLNAVFFAAWFLVIRQIKKRKWDAVTYRVIMTFLVMAELGCNAALCMSRMEHELTKQDVYESWNLLEENTFQKIKQNDKEEFYRILYLNPRGQNQAFVHEYNSFENFNSSEHRAMMKAVEKLGFFRGLHWVRGDGSTPVTRSLLNIKYVVGGITMESEIGDDTLHLAYEKNEKTLSLGYMVKEEIKDFIFEESPFENQNRLLSAMTGIEISCFEKTAMKMDTESGIYAKGDDFTCLLHGENEEGDAIFEFSASNDGRPLYIYFSQDRYVDATDGAEIPQIVTEDITPFLENTIWGPQLVPSRIVQIGTNEEGEYAFSIVLPEDLEADYYKKAYFCYYDETEFQKAYEKLKKQQWTVNEYGDGYVKGNISVQEKGIMFTSIPYDEGWTIIVDGAEAKAIPLLEDAFLGVELEKGEHEIEMYYEQRGVKEGKMISGSIFFLILVICTIRMAVLLSDYTKKTKKCVENRRQNREKVL